jgi:hypothetical protein
LSGSGGDVERTDGVLRYWKRLKGGKMAEAEVEI